MDRSWMQRGPNCLVKREAPATQKETECGKQGPEEPFAPVSERVPFVWTPGAAEDAFEEKQHDCHVGDVDRGLRSECCRSGNPSHDAEPYDLDTVDYQSCDD